MSKEKVWAPKEVKKESFVKNLGTLKAGVDLILQISTTVPGVRKGLLFLAGLPEDSKGGFLSETVNNRIKVDFTHGGDFVDVCDFGFGEKSVFFVSKNSEKAGYEIHKFMPFASITNKADLVQTLFSFITLAPKPEEIVGISAAAIEAKMDRYEEAATDLAGKIPLGFKERTVTK